MTDFDARNASVRVTWLHETGVRNHVEWSSVDARVRDVPGLLAGNLGEHRVEITLHGAEALAPPPTLEHRLALAVLDGDAAAALALSDDLQERHARPEGFVSREELLEVLGRLEWSGLSLYDMPGCPVCGNEEPDGHKPGCRLAKALGKGGA